MLRLKVRSAGARPGELVGLVLEFCAAGITQDPFLFGPLHLSTGAARKHLLSFRRQTEFLAKRVPELADARAELLWCPPVPQRLLGTAEKLFIAQPMSGHFLDFPLDQRENRRRGPIMVPTTARHHTPKKGILGQGKSGLKLLGYFEVGLGVAL